MFRLHLYAAVQPLVAQSSHSGPRVPAGHPVFPAPSFIWGWSDGAKLGRDEPRGWLSMS